LDTFRQVGEDIYSLVYTVKSNKLIKQIRRWLSIYRTGCSTYWHTRIHIQQGHKRRS